MTPAVDAPLVVLGAGLAGLTLAARLARERSGPRVVVLEPRTAYQDDRSWCFWRPEQHDLSHLVSQRWKTWTFSDAAGVTVRHQVPGLAYQYVRGSDFYASAQADIAESPRVDLRLGVRAGTVAAVSGGVRVETSEGTLLACQVIDTRPRAAEAMLYQSFVGVELERDHPLPFDPREVTLMGSLAADSEGLRFVYALPLGPNRAIVEWTRFGLVPINRERLVGELDQLLTGLGLADARRVRTEGGVLAMGLGRQAAPPIAGVLPAGNAGGALRAASGYGFLRIQRWAQLCTERLLAGREAVGHPEEPRLRRTFDRIFLQAVRAHPERTAEYFLALAHGVPPAGLVRFLSDGARAADYARIISSLPWSPFIAQLAAPTVFSPAPTATAATATPSTSTSAKR
ncbi:MAG: NAD(P)-binding protein [Cryobacterium sp.]|uniref:lycopene cyclase family protein n=1 Tax=unclassified Cryobacterium TaxID=2649013 RepID=UPI0018CBC8A7|nr:MULTISPECIES: lycopene cyclase family protein [unclassified Cryobacterium]MCY7405231.1 NAD(P)-binding protein [Cryobacterium sp.]MEC5153090.1 lycopene beta-cyclase [Cryobacterium sp. CAN_C3]